MDHDESAFAQIADELGLQAWLARAEFRNPSLSDPKVQDQVSALARTRDELRLQMHLGKLEAADEWDRLEGRWRHVKAIANNTAHDLAEGLHDMLTDIRDGYQRIGSDD